MYLLKFEPITTMSIRNPKTILVKIALFMLFSSPSFKKGILFCIRYKQQDEISSLPGYAYGFMEAFTRCIDGCYHFDLPLDVKKGIIRLVKYDLPIFQWVQ